MFLVSELLMVFTKDEGRPLKQQPKHMQKGQCQCVYILCFEMSTLLLCILWQIQVKTSNPQFPVTKGEVQKGHSLLKEDTILKGQLVAGFGGISCFCTFFELYHLQTSTFTRSLPSTTHMYTHTYIQVLCFIRYGLLCVPIVSSIYILHLFKLSFHVNWFQHP